MLLAGVPVQLVSVASALQLFDLTRLHHACALTTSSVYNDQTECITVCVYLADSQQHTTADFVPKAGFSCSLICLGFSTAS
jgi:hypothetical protein